MTQAQESVHLVVATATMEAKRRLNTRSTDDPSWFASTAGRLMQISDKDVDVGALVDAQMHCVRFFLTSRERQLGLAITDHALGLATSAGLLSEQRLLCNFAGVFHKESGKHVAAIEYFVRGISIARRIGHRQGEASIWANMASSANMMGLYEDAIKFARRALALAASDVDEIAIGARVAASQVLARACQVLGRFDEAMVAVQNALAQMPPAKSNFDHLMRVRIHHTHAVIALKVNNLSVAQSAAKLAEEEAQYCVGPDAVVHSSACRAMVDVRLGKIQDADAVTEGLLSRYASESTLIFDLFVARLDVLEQAKRTEEADSLRRRFRGEWQKHKMKNVIGQLRILDDAAAHDLTDGSMQAVRERLEELAIIGELHDDQTGEHAFRVGRLAGLLALRVGLGQEHADALDIAARLHDIGKITTPLEILMKPGRFTDDEWAVMQEHSAQGHKILSSRKDPLMVMAAQIALHHHERWDGGGYPSALKGNDIPQIAQIAALADVFDALSHQRCYKPAWSINASLAEIERVSRGYGRQDFETKIADEFICLVRELVEEHGEDGLDAYLSERASESAFRNARAAAGSTLEANQLAAAVLRAV
jgi:putative two-component system response regulator